MATRFSRREFAALATIAGLAAVPRQAFAQQDEASEGHGTVADGIAIYLGVLPSDVIAKDYGKNTPEYEMHEGPPGGTHFHHVLVALYDAETAVRITDAEVTATVRPVGLSGTTKKLEPFMVSDAMTYCNYFNMPVYGEYRIKIEIRHAGVPGVTKAELKFDHTSYN